MNVQLRELILNVIESSDSAGCSDDLTVASRADMEALADYLLESDKRVSAESAEVIHRDDWEEYAKKCIWPSCDDCAGCPREEGCVFCCYKSLCCYIADLSDYVVVSGNPLEGGLTIYGPFTSGNDATKWAECNDKTDLGDVSYWLAPLESPLSDNQ